MIVGYKTIGFTLEKNPKYEERGRYIEKLDFHINSVKLENNTATVGVVNNLSAPRLTTYKEDVQYTSELVLIGLTD